LTTLQYENLVRLAYLTAAEVAAGRYERELIQE